MAIGAKNPIWLLVIGAIVTTGVGFGSGLLVGRQFPVRRFERFGESRYLVEPATGKVCDPFKDPKDTGNPFDHAFDPTATSKNPVDQSLADIWKAPYPPPCGK